MNLVIDWGNTALKTGWFEGSTLVASRTFASAQALQQALAEQPAPRHVIVSSTNRPADALAGVIGRDYLNLSGETPVPIRKAYDTPTTLGADRVAAAVGATVRFPGEDCLILDLGTCLTADVVDRAGTFLGGHIAPGLQMRLRAMHSFTERLPLIEREPGEWATLLGTNTRSCMLSGALNGMWLELNGLIAEHRRERPGLHVLLCGGDAPVFESRLEQPIFAIPELVLIGLNRILSYNVE